MARPKKQEEQALVGEEPASKNEPQDKHDPVIIELSGIREEIGKLVRRMNDVQKSVDILYQDREILEDIQGSIQSLKEITRQHQQFIDSRVRDVKQDVAYSQHLTEESTKDIKNAIADNVGNLVDNIQSKKVVVVKETLVMRFRKWLQSKGVKQKTK